MHIYAFKAAFKPTMVHLKILGVHYKTQAAHLNLNTGC